MTKRGKVAFVLRLRRHEEFQHALPWQIEWLRQMSGVEQRRVADELEEGFSLDNSLWWWARNSGPLSCPDRLLRWRIIWWVDLDKNPKSCFARQGRGLALDLDLNCYHEDGDLFLYRPYDAVNGNDAPVREDHKPSPFLDLLSLCSEEAEMEELMRLAKSDYPLKAMPYQLQLFRKQRERERKLSNLKPI